MIDACVQLCMVSRYEKKNQDPHRLSLDATKNTEIVWNEKKCEV